MLLEQHRQAVLQLHLSDPQFYCFPGATYIRDLAVSMISFFQAITDFELNFTNQMPIWQIADESCEIQSHFQC